MMDDACSASARGCRDARVAPSLPAATAPAPRGRAQAEAGLPTKQRTSCTSAPMIASSAINHST